MAKKTKIVVPVDESLEEETKEIKTEFKQLTYLKKPVIKTENYNEGIILSLVTGETVKISKVSDEYKQYKKENSL